MVEVVSRLPDANNRPQEGRTDVVEDVVLPPVCMGVATDLDEALGLDHESSSFGDAISPARKIARRAQQVRLHLVHSNDLAVRVDHGAAEIADRSS